LRAAPIRIAHPDIPIPFSPALEHFVLPNAAKIVAAASAMFEKAPA
jgi:pyruvate/2-oxoglutarate/acetoin dehydrogenase E1 component